jgi:hypothetical protein
MIQPKHPESSDGFLPKCKKKGRVITLDALDIQRYILRVAAHSINTLGLKEMKKRTMIAAVTSAILVGMFAFTTCSASQPNIIFIFADDWGYGDMSKHGSTFCETPHLDRMAEEGIDFANFTVNSPVCSPSRVAIMTGQFPARQCIHQHFAATKSNEKRGMPDWMDPQGPSLARMLKEAGYKTGHFGKWHLGNATDSPTEDLYGYDAFATFNG